MYDHWSETQRHAEKKPDCGLTQINFLSFYQLPYQ